MKKHALSYIRAKCSPTSLVEIFLANPQSKGHFNDTIYFRKKKKFKTFLISFLTIRAWSCLSHGNTSSSLPWSSMKGNNFVFSQNHGWWCCWQSEKDEAHIRGRRNYSYLKWRKTRSSWELSIESDWQIPYVQTLQQDGSQKYNTKGLGSWWHNADFRSGAEIVSI